MKTVTEAWRNPAVDKRHWRPQSVVWELTLACNLRCGHCGSRAGRALPDEMDTAECLDAVRQLHELGCELITLSGGEPTLRDDWNTIAEEIARRKMYVNMVTNGIYGKGQSAAGIAKRALAAGMCNVGVSLDGPREIHDQIRGNGTFERTSAAIRDFVANGLSTTVMTTVNKLNVHHLWQIREAAIGVGAKALRLQLAKPMGTMGDHREWVLDPEEIGTLLPELARMKKAGEIDVRLGDSLGYYGKPDKVLREWSWKKTRTRWGGCQAGMKALGIQANGDIKGCLSMQAARGDADPFVEGNLRESSLEEIWYRRGAFSYNREFTAEALTHDCKACKKADLCRGGARCISTAMDGTTSHDDYCYYRLRGEQEELDWMRAGRSAAAAAALVLTVNTAGCADDDNRPERDAGPDAGDVATETDTEMAIDYGVVPEYGVEPTPTETESDTQTEEPALEYGVFPDYGVEPMPTEADYGVTPDYGVEIETDMIPVPVYGVTPDYGVLPDE